MPIKHPTAVRFANEKIRVGADLLTRYYFLKEVVDEWNATGMSAFITNTADVIEDGSATDGRNVITGIDATAIITRMMEVISDMEAGGNAKLNTVNKVAVNRR